MNNAKYNSESTIDVLKNTMEDLRKEIGDFKLAEVVSKSCSGKMYVYFNGTLFDMFVRIGVGTYFCVNHKCCYDINDNLIENDPHFYEWSQYRKMFPGKSLVIEDYFSPFYKGEK